MPMHDWTRVDDGTYHDFHALWLMAIRHALNRGLLPAGFYAQFEQVMGTGEADLLALERPDAPPLLETGSGAAPAVAVLQRAARAVPKRTQRRLAVRHVSKHRVVAVVELVSPGNKSSGRDFKAFVEKARNVLAADVHLLVVDPIPPTRRDPSGIHPAVWAAVTKRPRRPTPVYQPPPGRPLTAVSYQAGSEIVAAVEAFAVGERVPDMPLWLTPDLWVTVPLEATYEAAFAEVPDFWRATLAG